MEILTKIKTPANFNNQHFDESELSDNPEFLGIYDQHIRGNDVDYHFEDYSGFIKVIIS